MFCFVCFFNLVEDIAHSVNFRVYYEGSVLVISGVVRCGRFDAGL